MPEKQNSILHYDTKRASIRVHFHVDFLGIYSVIKWFSFYNREKFYEQFLGF